MKPIANWRRVITRAWSIRLMIAAAMLSGAEVALPFLEPYLAVPPRTFAALAGLTTAAAFAARLLAQKNLEE